MRRSGFSVEQATGTPGYFYTMQSKVRATGSGNINSMINYLYTSGRDDTSTASSDDSEEDFRYEKNHPLCVVLPRVHLGMLH